MGHRFPDHITGVAYGILANFLGFVISGAFLAAGLVKKVDELADPSRPVAWAGWATLFIALGVAGLIGTSANGVRLWLKRRAIRRVLGDKLVIVIGDVNGDERDRQKLNIRNSLLNYLGSCVDIVLYPKASTSSVGLVAEDVSRDHDVAQKLLRRLQGDILISGRVKSDQVLVLTFSVRSASAGGVTPYDLTQNRERPLELPKNFDADFGAAVATRVISITNALHGRRGDFLNPYATKFAQQIRPLFEHPRPNWSSDSRGDVAHSYAFAMYLVGLENGETAPQSGLRPK